MHSTTAIILAAGQGTRMKSELPKVMHPLCGLPIVHYGVQAAFDAGCDEVVVVVGHKRQLVEEYLSRSFAGRVRTVVQDPQRGTGDAARVGLSAVASTSARVFVMYGDVPLVRGDDVRAVLSALDGDGHVNVGLAFATCIVTDPTGYGRVLRGPDPGLAAGAASGERGRGAVVEVREQRDLRTEEERAVREINAGMYASSAALLREALATLMPNNAQGELYLTDAVAFAAGAGEHIATVELGADVLSGVNDREQLAQVEDVMYGRIARRWRLHGATVKAGARIDALVVIDADATIESGVALRGRTRIGRGATVDVGCVLTNVEVAEAALVKPYSVAADSRVGARASIGPFSHLRPESDIGEDAHVGNFVETKKTRMRAGAKANHLAYLGNGDVGPKANIGAGTIFCNYDGFQKHTTVVEEGVFIGSDSQVVAPVTIGAHAYVATGTTVTRDVPANALAIGRVKQENKEGYASKLRARLKAAKDEAK